MCMFVFFWSFLWVDKVLSICKIGTENYRSKVEILHFAKFDVIIRIYYVISSLRKGRILRKKFDFGSLREIQII